MVEQLTVGPSGSSGTLRRQLSYKINYMKSAQLVQLGQIDKSNLRCMTDDEDHLLLDDGNMIVVGSRMLWNDVFHTLNVKSFFGDWCYKQISKELGAGQSKQIYSVFVEVQGGQALPLFLALIKDSQRATYDRVFKYTFHYKKCIYQERDAVVLRSKAASGDIVDTYFRRLGVMPFLAPHIFNISECLPHHACLVISRRRLYLITF
uniref:Gelsolin-like domain-containing protein n=1 Tax=Heterorhabditis bacteriophora TaxID=37862 RepID=A0A1I7XUF3_HETBA